jgi:hypothetical protein
LIGRVVGIRLTSVLEWRNPPLREKRRGSVDQINNTA